MEGTNFHGITFLGSGESTVSADGVDLPNVLFESGTGTWNLASDFKSTRIDFLGGSFNTGGFSVRTDLWRSLEQASKNYNFGSSEIQVDGEFLLAQFPTSNVTLDAGTSLIVCESIKASGLTLNDLRLLNSTTIPLPNFPMQANVLYLAGSAPLLASADLSVAELVFEVDGASLELSPSAQLTVSDAITSLASGTNPGRLASRTAGSRFELDKPTGNLCVSGPVAFQDIEFVGPGIMHAPQGIDDGNNAGIEFDNAIGSSTLYWVGGSGSWTTSSNWSGRTGGCPAGRSPGARSSVIIDDNGLFQADDQIDIVGPIGIDAMTFSNSSKGVILQITDDMEAQSLTISGGDLTLRGSRFEVIGQTTLPTPGVLISDLDEGFTTGGLSNTAGLVIVRAGSTATVKTLIP